MDPAPTSPEASAGSRRWLETAALLALAVAVGAVARAWDRLPDSVPMHFDLMGRTDGWGSRGSLLLLPGMALGMYLLLTFVERLPAHWYNFPVAVTDENRARQHRLARELVLRMKAVLMGLFAHLTIGVVRAALGEAEGIGAWTMPFWLALIFGLLAAYLVRARRAR